MDDGAERGRGGDAGQVPQDGRGEREEQHGLRRRRGARGGEGRAGAGHDGAPAHVVPPGEGRRRVRGRRGAQGRLRRAADRDGDGGRRQQRRRHAEHDDREHLGQVRPRDPPDGQRQDHERGHVEERQPAGDPVEPRGGELLGPVRGARARGAERRERRDDQQHADEGRGEREADLLGSRLEGAVAGEERAHEGELGAVLGRSGGQRREGAGQRERGGAAAAATSLGHHFGEGVGESPLAPPGRDPGSGLGDVGGHVP